MAYCSFCGGLLPEGANFCANCGAAVQAAAQAPVYTNTVATQVYTGEGYAVMLLSTGGCGASAAADLLSDTCGYSDAEALMLVSSAPTLIAKGLTQEQAVYLAQSLTEYGMEAAIYDRNGNRTLHSGLDSVFDSAGAFLTRVASALGLIGIGNRITTAIRRVTLPSRPPVYTLTKPVPRPPVRRHTIARSAPAPQPGKASPRPQPVQVKPQPRHGAGHKPQAPASAPRPQQPGGHSPQQRPAGQHPEDPRRDSHPHKR